MHRAAVDLVRLDPATLDDATAAGWAGLRAELLAEELPDDPPRPVERLVLELQTPTADKDVEVWLGLEGGRVVAVGDLELHLEDNLHVAFLDAGVARSERRRGVGTAFLRAMAERVHELGRTKLMTWCEQGSGGEPFLQRYEGAKMAYLARKSRLLVDELDRALLERWARPAEGYSVLTWDAPTPAEHLQAYADVLNVMNTAPMQDLDLEDEVFTPALVEGWERQVLDRKGAKHVAVARHDATGQVVGLTELVYDELRPTMGFQWNTGVDGAHRGHGLGSTLKAVNALRLLDERPQVRTVDTFNQDENEPMLAINTAMGFRPLIRYTQFVVPVEALLA